MRILDIQKMATTHQGEGKFHESIFRSYHILRKVIEYLERGVPADVILELVKEMNSNENV